jgi:hypothetical protein
MLARYWSRKDSPSHFNAERHVAQKPRALGATLARGFAAARWFGSCKDTVDYSVFCGEWCIGRIYETRTGPESLRWFWALHAPSKPRTPRTDNRATIRTDRVTERY